MFKPRPQNSFFGTSSFQNFRRAPPSLWKPPSRDYTSLQVVNAMIAVVDCSVANTCSTQREMIKGYLTMNEIDGLELPVLYNAYFRTFKVAVDPLNIIFSNISKRFILSCLSQFSDTKKRSPSSF